MWKNKRITKTDILANCPTNGHRDSLKYYKTRHNNGQELSFIIIVGDIISVEDRRHIEGKCFWLDERWNLTYLLFLLQWNRMWWCVTGMSVWIGLVVVKGSPLFVVIVDVNVRVINIVGGCLLNNVHNSCGACYTNWSKCRQLSAVSLTQNLLYITHSFVLSVSIGVAVNSLEQYVKVSAPLTFVTVKRVQGLI
jgi:hypothetical protein